MAIISSWSHNDSYACSLALFRGFIRAAVGDVSLILDGTSSRHKLNAWTEFSSLTFLLSVSSSLDLPFCLTHSLLRELTLLMDLKLPLRSFAYYLIWSDKTMQCTIKTAGASRANAQNCPNREAQNYLNHVLAINTTSTTSGSPAIHRSWETDVHIRPGRSNLFFHFRCLSDLVHTIQHYLLSFLERRTDFSPNQRVNKLEDIICDAILEMTRDFQRLSSRVTIDRVLDLLIYIAILSGYHIDACTAMNVF